MHIHARMSAVLIDHGLCRYQFFMNGVRLGTYSVIKDWTGSDNPQTRFASFVHVALRVTDVD